MMTMTTTKKKITHDDDDDSTPVTTTTTATIQPHVRIQALCAVLVYKRPHKSNEALPARITIPNQRSDFLTQWRTLSTGHWVLVL